MLLDQQQSTTIAAHRCFPASQASATCRLQTKVGATTIRTLTNSCNRSSSSRHSRHCHRRQPSRVACTIVIRQRWTRVNRCSSSTKSLAIIVGSLLARLTMWLTIRLAISPITRRLCPRHKGQLDSQSSPMLARRALNSRQLLSSKRNQVVISAYHFCRCQTPLQTCTLKNFICLLTRNLALKLQLSAASKIARNLRTGPTTKPSSKALMSNNS